MTTLSDRLVEYLDHRRRFGYRRIGTTAAVLRRFAAFADDFFGAESITTELFLPRSGSALACGLSGPAALLTTRLPGSP